MPSAKQKYGGLAEQQAADFLLRKGYAILDRHVTSRYGEIDLVADDRGTIVFVEVKARRSQKFGTAAESVTKKKLERLRLAIEEYVQKKGWENRSMRMDVVAIDRKNVTHLQGVAV